MNTISSRHVYLLLSLVAVTVISSAMSAQAETTKSADDATMSASSLQGSQSVAAPTPSDSALTPVSNSDALAVDTTEKLAQETKAPVNSVQSNSPAGADEAQLATTAQELNFNQIAQPTQTSIRKDISFPSYVAVNDAVNAKPVPGTMATSAAALKTEPSASPVAQTTSGTQDSNVAQVIPPVDPGRRTRGGSSYLGIGGNIGLGGDTALGDGGFAVFSKIGLTRSFSFRPAGIIDDDPTILLPLTYDFNLRRGDDPFEPARFAPYLGAGAAIHTGDDTDVGFLVTGGVDVPLTPNFTATASVNASFKDDTEVGILLGVGYNFRGL